MPAIYEHLHTVTDAEIDELGHVGNIVYLQWTQTAALAHSAAQGWPAEAYRKLGAGFVVRSHQIEYLRPALPGDEIVVHTWVADFRRVSSLRRFEIVRPRDDALLVTAQTRWAFVQLASGRPTRIPPEVQTAFEIVAGEAR